MLRLFKNFIKRGLQRVGYDIAPYPPPDSLAKHLQMLLPSLGIDCVLDVGANEGQYGAFLRRFGYQGDIVSFEPTAGPYALLEKRCSQDRRWRAHRVALGSKDAVAAINVMPSSPFTSFLSPSRYAAEQFGDKVKIQRREEVQVRRLDGMLENCLAHVPPPRRIFLKMDTQGYDLEVLRGAEGILAQVLALQSEISVAHAYEGMTDYLDAIKFMNGLGFELTALFPVGYDKEGVRVTEFDCVMRRARTECSTSPS